LKTRYKGALGSATPVAVVRELQREIGGNVYRKYKNEGRPVDIVYLDFSKAFNTLSHKMLLENLMKYGLDEQSKTG